MRVEDVALELSEDSNGNIFWGIPRGNLCLDGGRTGNGNCWRYSARVGRN